jgi:4-hydroxy-2-oxoglutarate aldolase
MAKASIAGTKAMLERLHGYGGAPRRPLPAMDVDEAEKLWNHVYVQELIKLEREISTT